MTTKPPGPMEAAFTYRTRSILRSAVEAVPEGTESPSVWAAGFEAGVLAVGESATLMAMHADDAADHFATIARVCNPAASVFKLDGTSVKHYGSTLDLDAVADIVSKATAIDRDSLEWREVDGKMQLWIAMPDRAMS